MRMKNSRSSTTDRSREPILKKPRLVEGEQQDRTSNDVRQLPQRVSTPAGPGSGPTVQRFRAKEEDEDTERDNSLREAYQQQQQELVRDYKNGLAELTFNSKPIITNLSIIAGENLQAAKGIAAAISSNIIEVPADQKLPSLYLLDSIVKNIGRDYIKHFASRLPEVFCKAYRQVDSAMRNSMRHLFGTWRKVFPPACLQIIEKELDFAPVMNDSSSGLTPARSDSQSQRQTHSIHVNPKYLETRQRLQPLDRAMTSNDSTGTKVTSDDAERPDKVAVFGAGRPWANMSTKMNNNARLQREVPSQHINEKIPGAAYSDHNYISDSPTRMDLRAGISERVGERGVTNNALYGAESITLKSTAAQRNAFGSKNGFANDGVSRSAQFAAQLQPTQGISNRNSAGISKNWKNSEEEEFMWDDVKSKLTESNILKKEVWAPDDSKKQVLDDHFTRSNGEHDIWSRVHRGTSTDSVSIAQSRETSFGKRVPSTWPSQDTHPVDGLNNVNVASRKPGKAEGFSTTLSGSTSMIPSSARVGLQPHTEPSVSGAPSFGSLVNLLSGSGGAFIQQGKHPLISTSLSVDSQSQNMSEQIYQQDQYFPEIYKRPPQHGGKLRLDPRLQTTNDAYSVLPNHILPGTTQHLEQDLQTSTSFMRSARGHQVQESQSEPTQSRPFGKPSNESSNCGTTSVSTKDSLLAAIMKSGLLSSHSLTGNLPNLNLQDSRSLPLNMNLSHSEPSEPPPRIATSSKGTVGLASVLSPPTAPGPPAHSLSSNASELADVTKSVGNPLSSLLSSLVAKGLISASSTESETERAPQVPDPLENKRQHLGRSSSTEAFTDPVSSTIPSSSGSELPVLKPASKNTIALSDVAMTEKTDLIGVEFRPDIIRELHPPVISSLFEDLLHQCSKCGARVRYQDQLDRHLELHNLKEHENSSSKRVSRTWFKRSEDWVSGKMEPSREVLTETSTDPLVKPDDKSEPVVPAVESQSACVICGEPFEDSYSHERDEWMYRGAVYLTTPAGGGKDGVTDESDTQGPIVHPNCISSSSAYELGLI